MPAFALPLAPAVGEGLLWGAGLLGSGLTALGIIENKDAIRDGISDFGSWISNGVGNGIKAWSEAMSPKGPAGPNPNYDVATGKPIAVADVTRVQRPIPVFRQQIQPRPFGATRSVRHDSDGEPIFFPWQTGSPERPIRLNPVTVTESRIMRTDAEGAQPEQPATDSTSVAPAQPAAGGATDTGSSTASPAPASPEPERNDSTSNKAPFLQRVRPHLRPFGGYKGGSYMGNAGRLLRDAAYTGFGADVGFNLYESAENPDYQWKWGISRLTTFPERGVLQQLRRVHNSTPEDSIRPAQTQSTQQQGTQVVASPDSVMPMQVDPVAPNDTLNIF